MYNATIGIIKPLARVEISEDIEEDLRIWANFLTNFNGKTIYASNTSLTSQDLNFFSDSSLKGFGATFLPTFIVGTFPKKWEKLGTQFLELYPNFLMAHIFAPKLVNKHITFYCDNQPVVHILNKQSTPVQKLMLLVREMVMVLLKYIISFKALHIFDLDNSICDDLSRQKGTPEFLRQFHLDSSQLPSLIIFCQATSRKD